MGLPELDCLVGALPRDVLAAAARRSREVGLPADRVLIAWGVIDDSFYLDRLSRHTGIVRTDLTDVRRGSIILREDQLPFAAQAGLVPIRTRDGLVLVTVPRHCAARNLTTIAANDPAIATRLRLANDAELAQLLTRGTRGLAHHAAHGVADADASLSAAPRRSQRRRVLWLGAVFAALCAGAACAPGLAGIVVAVWFLAFSALRLVTAALPARTRPPSPRIGDAELPTYSVIVALYREANMVARLLAALDALDYPREKLDILIAVEADDLATRAALARGGTRPYLRVVIAPPEGPKTKPKALNAALPFARGSFVAVYDAEDRPDPHQLRAALDVFRSGGDALACVQARLVIDHVRESPFATMFAAEYAGLFGVVLPGLARLKLTLPLGGSSNHFRTDILRKVGAWDAWNVTEDADLGFRLARHGYRSVAIASPTHEEAPLTFGPWLHQRTRWMKGWMQTWAVHMRSPRRLWREAGWRGVLSLNLLLGGNVLSALAYPVLVAVTAADIGSRVLRGVPLTWLDDAAWLHAAAIASGVAATLAVGLRGLAQARQLRHGWIFATLPIYWGLLSIATLRALHHYAVAPYHWDKTTHGLARQRVAPPAAAAPKAAPRRRAAQA